MWAPVSERSLCPAARDSDSRRHKKRAQCSCFVRHGTNAGGMYTYLMMHVSFLTINKEKMTAQWTLLPALIQKVTSSCAAGGSWALRGQRTSSSSRKVQNCLSVTKKWSANSKKTLISKSANEKDANFTLVSENTLNFTEWGSAKRSRLSDQYHHVSTQVWMVWIMWNWSRWHVKTNMLV